MNRRSQLARRHRPSQVRRRSKDVRLHGPVAPCSSTRYQRNEDALKQRRWGRELARAEVAGQQAERLNAARLELAVTRANQADSRKSVRPGARQVTSPWPCLMASTSGRHGCTPTERRTPGSFGQPLCEESLAFLDKRPGAEIQLPQLDCAAHIGAGAIAVSSWRTHLGAASVAVAAVTGLRHNRDAVVMIRTSPQPQAARTLVIRRDTSRQWSHSGRLAPTRS